MNQRKDANGREQSPRKYGTEPGSNSRPLYLQSDSLPTALRGPVVGVLVPILHMCEELVPILQMCEELVPILQMCEELVPILHTSEIINMRNLSTNCRN